MQSKTKSKILVSLFLLSLVSIFLYFLIVRDKPKSFIEIDKFYDANGHEINGYSIVAGVHGVKYITFKINVKNKDNIPLNLRVTGLSPRGLGYAIPPQELRVGPGQTGVWITDKIDITPYEGTIQDFCAVVESDKVFVLRGENEVRGCIDLQIKPNPLSKNNSDFQVEIDSSVGDNSINPSCEEDWVCSLWSLCIDSSQKRNCHDSNECGTTSNKPIEKRLCSSESSNPGGDNSAPLPDNSQFLTNAVNGDYKHNDIWISLSGKKYYYDGYSTYNCLSENIILNTPEGYPVCTRPGYEITKRVYIQQGGYGLIFDN